MLRSPNKLCDVFLRCLIHSWLQPGAVKFGTTPKPFETLSISLATVITWLKPGVNEMTGSLFDVQFLSCQCAGASCAAGT